MAEESDPSPPRPAPEPMAIERIEIVDQTGGAALFIWTRGARDPIVMRFDERATALAYVRDLWERRQQGLRREDDD